MKKSDKFWDKFALRYAKSPVSDKVTYQRKLTETQAYLAPDKHILEFGCGTGTTAIYHAPYVQYVDALDISENMLNIAREKAQDAEVENVKFTRTTLTEFNADTASIDGGLGLNVSHVLPDRQVVLSEVARILKPGGIFVSSTACLGKSPLRFIKFIVPLGKYLGLMPDVFILTEEKLAYEIRKSGLAIKIQWHHGKGGTNVFIIARKI